MYCNYTVAIGWGQVGPKPNAKRQRVLLLAGSGGFTK